MTGDFAHRPREAAARTAQLVRFPVRALSEPLGGVAYIVVRLRLALRQSA